MPHHVAGAVLAGGLAVLGMAIGLGLAESGLGAATERALGLGAPPPPVTTQDLPQLPLAEQGAAPAAPPPSPPPAQKAVPNRDEARAILTAAAHHHGLNPNFLYAVSWWESGWDQSQVSSTGAVGLMQIEPYTAEGAGPALLGRPVDIHDPVDNAELGAALLRQYLLEFRDGHLALAAYYQGEGATHERGIYPDSHAYTNGIWNLFRWLEAGHSLPA